METSRETRVRRYVEEVHAEQTYGGQPYTRHLDLVKTELAAAGLTSESDRIIADGHDVIEDAGDRRDEVIAFMKANTTDFEFHVIWALTGIGHNRKTRNADAKAKIAAFPQAANYKLADRIVNWENSALGSSHRAMYEKEDNDFFSTVVGLADNEYLVARYNALRSTKGV